MKSLKEIKKNRCTIKRKMSTKSKINKGGVRQSSRLNPSGLSIETKPLGNERKDANFSPETISVFINSSIQENNPVIISLPVPFERHAFLILVLPRVKKIMVADWFVRNIGEIEDNKWSVYNIFMALLQEKYRGYNFEFFPVDKKLHKESMKHHKDNGGSGGCSDYIYKWIEKYNGDLEYLLSVSR